MRVRPLDVGVESVDEYHRSDDVRLPSGGALNQPFLPQYEALDAILRRPSLEERLPALMQPASLDPELLQPVVLAATRLEARNLFLRAALRADGDRRAAFEAAVATLDDAASLDEEVRASLAALLRG
jgi:hypothetical protein